MLFFKLLILFFFYKLIYIYTKTYIFIFICRNTQVKYAYLFVDMPNIHDLYLTMPN